ncbi:MAG: pilus assembly protein PilM [Bacteriovoracaceae bacterium]|nr:pilus assembly protein PilM [Bacteriovoracaceae bacterium]
MPSLQEKLQELLGGISSGPVMGLDLGSHSIKLCEMSGSSGKWKLDKFAIIPLSEAAIIEDEFQKPEEIVEAIQAALRTAGIKSKNVCIGLYGQNTMTKRLSVPDGSKEEIQDHIMWESEQYIPFGADESEIDFHVIGDTEGGGKDALVAAARTDVVERFQDLIKEAKLQVKYIDLNVIALSNIFEETAVVANPDLAEGSILIDYGAQSIKLVIYRNGGPIFSKELPMGGSLITEEIQRQMAVSYEEAEDLKTTKDDNGNLPEEILTIIQSQLESQIVELKKNLNFYISAGSTEQVTNCFLMGGCSRLPLLKEMLDQSLGMEVEIFNPFDYGVKCSSSALEDNIEQIAAVGTVVMGLGMRA